MWNVKEFRLNTLANLFLVGSGNPEEEDQLLDRFGMQNAEIRTPVNQIYE
jgi:Mg-chelatase subunit ChlI